MSAFWLDGIGLVEGRDDEERRNEFDSGNFGCGCIDHQRALFRRNDTIRFVSQLHQQHNLEDRCVTDKETVTGRWIVAGTVALLAAYLVQALFSVGDQGAFSKAMLEIGHQALRNQYKGIPELRVVGAVDGPTQCSFWNFEATWGHCVGVALDVRNYKPEHQAAVDTQARLLGERLRKPCELLPTLNLPDAYNISQALGCDAGRKTFKLMIYVTAVTVINEKTNPSDPYMWRAMDHQKLHTYILKGEI